MSSTTLQSQSYAPARPQAVGDALRELAAAAGRVLKATLAALPSRSDSPPAALTPAQEASRVRDLAGTYVKTDPGFAGDLYAAADRYERTHGL